MIDPSDPIEAYLTPISEHARSGVDARHEADYELLREEIAKLSTPVGACPDWARIESVGGGLLAGTSKDLLVAVYVACALTARAGVTGAARGASMLGALFLRFGQTLFPQRTRARVSALEWYLEWLCTQLDSATTTSPPDAQRLREQLRQLHDAARDVLGEACPSFASALRSCERSDRPTAPTDHRSHAAPVPAGVPPVLPPAPPPLAQQDAAVVVAQAPLPAAASLASTLGPLPALPASPALALPELQVQLARTGSSLVLLARARFEADRTDARSYRWLRSGVWLRFERAPVPNRRGRTDLDGPSPARHAELSRAAHAEQWDQLLQLSERQLVKTPLWLDLNRYSALALEKLGAAFADACAHVLRETRALLARLPELTSLSFSDGAPFASADALRWLAPPLPRGPVQAVTESGELEEALCDRLRDGEPTAILELERRLSTTLAQRTAFLLRLQLASVLERAGRLQGALHVYLGLERELDTFQVERWEPELALRVLRPMWNILSAGDGPARPHADRVAIRLSRLSPTLFL